MIHVLNSNVIAIGLDSFMRKYICKKCFLIMMITTDDNLWPLVKLRINFTGGLQVLTTNI